MVRLPLEESHLLVHMLAGPGVSLRVLAVGTVDGGPTIGAIEPTFLRIVLDALFLERFKFRSIQYLTSLHHC